MYKYFFIDANINFKKNLRVLHVYLQYIVRHPNGICITMQ